MCDDSTYLLNMSVTRSISCSAAAIFSADDGWGRPNPNIDMIAGDCSSIKYGSRAMMQLFLESCEMPMLVRPLGQISEL
jgi:hypothetical protein